MKLKCLISFTLLFCSCKIEDKMRQNSFNENRNTDKIKDNIKIKNPNLFNEMWHLKNTGQNSYSNISAKKGIDLNIENIKETGKNIRILIADSAVYLDHEDLIKNKIINGSLNFSNFLIQQTNSMPIYHNTNTHGTNVAGIIAGSLNSNNGFRGVASNAKIASSNILDNNNFIQSSFNNNFLTQYTYANNQKFQIINQSYGSEAFYFPALYSDNATINNKITSEMKRTENGYVVVSAAGNSACSLKLAMNYYNLHKFTVNLTSILSQMTPQKLNTLTFDEKEFLKRIRSHQSNFDEINSNPNVIVVSAITAQGIIADYSSVGSNIWVTGFGGGNTSQKTDDTNYFFELESKNPDIITTNIPGFIKTIKSFDYNSILYPVNQNYKYTASFNGTSAATPSISGVIALMLEANPHLTFGEIKYILAKSANRESLEKNPKPYCVKTLEKLSLFDNANHFWQPWNKSWVINAAGNAFHHFYGFGLVDAEKAVKMAKTLNYPYKNLQPVVEEIANYSINTVISAGNQNESISFESTKDLIIQSVNIYPIINAQKADGISVELISPSGTESTIIFPGNSFIKDNPTSSNIDMIYPGYPANKAPKNIGLLTNAFYEENSKGIWKIRIKNGNLKTPSNSTIDLHFLQKLLNLNQINLNLAALNNINSSSQNNVTLSGYLIRMVGFKKNIQ